MNGARGQLPPMTSGVVGPSTPACDAARRVAAEVYDPALLNHCYRSYVWGESYAVAHSIAFDTELLFVAALLHDVGLVPVFDSATAAFEEAGAAVARVFAAGAGWSRGRAIRLGEVIVRHMWDLVDPMDDPEGHLLEMGTALDISGRGCDLWPADFRIEVVTALPRLDLAARFSACFLDQAHRKPASSAAGAVQAGIVERIACNPLDEVGGRPDPGPGRAAGCPRSEPEDPHRSSSPLARTGDS